MAGKVDTAKGKAKGVAFGKWAKIDKAQRNMFLAVCGASLALGITFVAVVYFAKVISFNANLISEKDKVINDYKTIQANLETISGKVADLTSNENLEVVARERADDCITASASSITDSDAIESIEVARTCTALRVIPDAVPSSLNQEATLASLDLMIKSVNGASLIGLSGSDVDNVSFEGEGDEEDEEESEDGEGSGSLEPIGAALNVEGTETSIKNVLEKFESSIRNYDIASATLSWTGGAGVDLSAVYRAYYSGKVGIEKKTKKVCADKTSAKCTGRKN